MGIYLGGSYCFCFVNRGFYLGGMGKVEGTRAAFIKLLSEPGFPKKYGYNKATVAGWKSRAENGEEISLDKMEKVLLDCGATVVSEKIWNLK